MHFGDHASFGKGLPLGNVCMGKTFGELSISTKSEPNFKHL